MCPLLTMVSSTSNTAMGDPGCVISRLTSKKSRRLVMSCSKVVVSLGLYFRLSIPTLQQVMIY